MRGFRQRLGAALVAVVLGATVAACSPGNAQPQTKTPDGGRPDAPANLTLATAANRESTGVVAQGGPGAPYNYGPTVMLDGGKVRMWWCSQYPDAGPPGDDILYGESTSLDGPFTGPGSTVPPAVLSGNPGQFDGMHTCDPSVVRAGGTYYLYYTGAANDHALGNAIGLATSTDGLTWARADTPIVGPSHDVHRDNLYGTGQPSAVYLDGWFYLMFTDTSGKDAGWNGAGQFVLRAKDPRFAAGVESLSDNGFTAVTSTTAPRTMSVVDAFSAELEWSDALGAFVIAHETQDGTTLTFWNRDFTAHPYRAVVVPGPWEEGPGLVRRPDGHAPASESDPCGRIPVDVIRATRLGEAHAPTDLRHYGLDLTGLTGCADQQRALGVLDGFAMPSPARTMDLVVAGKVVRIDRRSVAEQLATHVLDQRVGALDGAPVAAHLSSGARALEAAGLGLGFLLDDGKLWPVHPASVASLNGSTVELVSAAQWRAHPQAAPLGK
ncbi:beta-xylosidase [Amycolatopsis pithecellobii]|uniref:Beta-xylosidase n=1 Tax=Amycolatopsis pithecellobii TaxID=664692 RepID=A0A6N7YVI7_9PSEU|nr:beta-xylosidase [Amycolatopsis pithecellobii]MTD55928.1 beta-xylosidase [Amycolatopsis pithecellobii]